MDKNPFHIRLAEFYKQNDLPEHGGIKDDFVYLSVGKFKIKAPNPEFRKKVVHIHDLAHITHNCDTTWKGEAFVAGWEISTKMWKHLPIGFYSLFAFGYSLWIHPKSVFQGFKKGLFQKGIIHLPQTRNELLAMNQEALELLLDNGRRSEIKFSDKVNFLLWCFLSQVLLFLPLLLLLGIIVLIR